MPEEHRGLSIDYAILVEIVLYFCLLKRVFLSLSYQSLPGSLHHTSSSLRHPHIPPAVLDGSIQPARHTLISVGRTS